MTVSNQKRSIRYQGNDSATEFDYDFLIEEATHVEVIIYNSTDETYTTLTGGQYTITGLNDPGFGAVTYPLAGDPLSTDEYIIINRVAPYVQVMDILPQGGFYPAVIEAAMDRTTRQIQQIAEIQSRSLFVVEGEGFQKRLPLRSLLVDRVLAFDENGDPTLGPTATNVDNAQGYANAAAAAQTAAETAQGLAEDAQMAAETAQTGAETAETNAGNSATAAATSADEAVAAAAAYRYTFDSDTADSDPGTGEIKLNNADPTAATVIYISTTDGEGTDLTNEIGEWDDATNAVRGKITLRTVADPAVKRTYNITGTTTVGTGYRKLQVTYVGGAGSLTGTLLLFVNRAGNAGSPGAAGSADVPLEADTPPTFEWEPRERDGAALPAGVSLVSDPGYAIAADGSLRWYPANTPRHDHDVYGNRLGVLREPAIAVLPQYTEDFSQPVWLTTNCTPGAAVAAPNGENAATRMDLSGTDTTGNFRQEIAFVSGTRYVLFAVVKAGTGVNWAGLQFRSAAFGENAVAYFDLANGVAGSASGTIFEHHDIIKFPNGWCLIWAIAEATASASEYFRVYAAEGDLDTVFTGSLSGKYFDVWFASVAAVGAVQTVPPMYYPRESAAVTRARDDYTFDPTLLAIDKDRGSLFFEGDTRGPATGMTYASIFKFRRLDSDIRGWEMSTSTSALVSRWRDDGDNVASFVMAALADTQFRAFASIGSQGVLASLNGSNGGWSGSAQDVALDGYFFLGRGVVAGSDTDDQDLNGHIKKVAFWDRSVADTDVADGFTGSGIALAAPRSYTNTVLKAGAELGGKDTEGFFTRLKALLESGAADGKTIVFEKGRAWDAGSTRPTSPYITLPRTVRLEWQRPWDLTGFASTTSSPIILQRGGSLTGSAIDLSGTPSLTKESTDRVTVATGQGVNFAVGERWLLHATASLTTLTGAFTLLDSAGSPYYNRRCESVWVERVEGDVVYFTKPISDDYPNSCDPRLIKYDDDIDIELINPMVDAFTPYADVDEGNWATSTAYSVGDHVIQSNRGYVCLIAHTSGTFATDLAAARWQDMGSDRFLDVTLARRLRIIGGRARRLSGMFARISGVADLEIDGLRGDMNDKGSAAPGGFLFVGGDTDGARFRNLDVTGGGQPFMQSSTGGHYGVMRNSLWENCISRGSLNGAFSQHNIEERTTYRNCKAIDCDGPAFDVRTRGNRMHNCEAIRCGTVLYLRNVADDFEIDGLTAESCISGLRLTTFSGAHEVTPGSIDIRNVSMRDIGGTGSVGALSMEYGYDVLIGRLTVENFNAAMNNATIAMTIGGRWNRPEFKNVSIHGTSGTGRPIYMHDAGLGAAKGPYAPTVHGFNYGSTYAEPLVQNLGGVPTWKDQTVINGGAATITISSGGALTLLFADSYIVSANSGTTDNLDTMPLMADGTRRSLRAASGHTITARNVDNIVLRGGAASVNFTSTALLTLVAFGSNWYEV